MSVLASNLVGQANLHFFGAGLRRPAEVVFGIANLGEQSAGACAVAVRDTWIDNMLPLQHNTCLFEGVSVKLGPNDEGPTGDASAAINGTRALNPESSQVAVLFRKSSGSGGRWNRGRLYLPGIPETLIDDGGTLDTAYLDDCAAAGVSFLDDLASADVAMIILHSEFSTKKVAGVTTKVVNPHADDAPSPVVGLVPDSLAATQRRRLRG